MTIWQRGHLNVNDVTAFPRELLQPCADAGYAVAQVMLNPEHPSTSIDQVPLSYLRTIRELGMRAWGFVWADDFRSPEALFDFVRGWRETSLTYGCGLTGIVANCEDGWEAHDQAGQRWSERFLKLFRAATLSNGEPNPCAKLSLGINTYHGGKGCDLAAWQRRGARLYAQTFHEGVTHEWPIDGYKQPLADYGFTHWVKVKPNWGTYNPYPSRAEQIASAKAAGTIGFAAWYAEGAGDPHEVLIPLLREAKAAGVCL